MYPCHATTCCSRSCSRLRLSQWSARRALQLAPDALPIRLPGADRLAVLVVRVRLGLIEEADVSWIAGRVLAGLGQAHLHLLDERSRRLLAELGLARAPPPLDDLGLAAGAAALGLGSAKA